jgi:hypothetical protein
MASPYVLLEIEKKLPRLVPTAAHAWSQLKNALITVPDVWSLDRPVIFHAAKDRPVLFAAAAWAEVLLTLDRTDFGPAVVNGFLWAGYFSTRKIFRTRAGSGQAHITALLVSTFWLVNQHSIWLKVQDEIRSHAGQHAVPAFA